MVDRPPLPAPLAPEEIEHYGWLLSGLIGGARRLLERAPPSQERGVTLYRTLGEAEELLDELMARIHETEEAR